MTTITTTPDIAGIEAAAELVAVGHAALRDALMVGVREQELWTAVEAALCAHHGAPVEAVVDLMSGPRTEQIGLPPSARRVAAGEPVLFDLAPLCAGWWADSCVTLSCGVPSAALRRRHAAVSRALEAGISAVRPGVRAGRVDRVIRAALASASLDCPHHTGHGVGAAAQQAPWLRPGEDALLEAGMVVALEPGVYYGGYGVRLEHLVLVADDGPRVLTTHSLELT